MRYREDAPDIHCLFGWMQVGSIYHPGIDARLPPDWAADHPHVSDAAYYSQEDSNNTLYVARQWLRIPGVKRKIKGGGIFRLFDKKLCLTATGCSRSIWKLPKWFYPRKSIPALSCHADMRRWRKNGDSAILETVARGQEFVLDSSYYPDAKDWLKSIFTLA